MTLISVVTVCKNDREGLLATHGSFVEQQCSEAEQIIIVAPSEDGSHIAAANLATSDVHVIGQPPLGIYPAMNLGWREATGEWVIFLNAGDSFVSENSLIDAIEVLATLDEKTQTVFFAGQICNAGDLLPVRPQGKVSRKRFAYSRLKTIHGSVAMRRSLIKALDGFREDFHIASDYDLILRAFDHGVSTSDLLLSKFNVGGVSTTNIALLFHETRVSRLSVLLTSRTSVTLDYGWHVYRLIRHWSGRFLRLALRQGNS